MYRLRAAIRAIWEHRKCWGNRAAGLLYDGSVTVGSGSGSGRGHGPLAPKRPERALCRGPPWAPTSESCLRRRPPWRARSGSSARAASIWAQRRRHVRPSLFLPRSASLRLTLNPSVCQPAVAVLQPRHLAILLVLRSCASSGRTCSDASPNLQSPPLLRVPLPSCWPRARRASNAGDDARCPSGTCMYIHSALPVYLSTYPRTTSRSSPLPSPKSSPEPVSNGSPTKTNATGCPWLLPLPSAAPPQRGQSRSRSASDYSHSLTCCTIRSTAPTRTAP